MTLRRRIVFAALLLLVTLGTRLSHLDIVWVEEAYPAAAAIQMSEHGKAIYQDFFFDKPPGAAYFYRLFGAYPGWPLRIAGAIFVLACAALAFAGAHRLWGKEAEAWTAAGFTVFFLAFDHPAAVMAIAPDLLMILPHLAALYLVARKNPGWAGVACGVAFWINPKAAFIGVACLLWSRSPRFVATATATSVLLLAPVWQGWWEQVVVWGRAYSADPPTATPVWDGIRHTGSWIWFHLTLVIGSLLAAWKDDRERRWLWIVMSGCNLAAAGLGMRFYPRYYFQLLPLLVLLAARGLWVAPRLVRCVMLGLLLIPAVRFGRQYPVLAMDLIQKRPHQWNQLALAEDSREAAAQVQRIATTGDTLFVWGYRPDILMRTRMPLGAPYLDSQPLNGVLADRHLVSSKPSLPARGTASQEIRSTFVVDGLGLLNPSLAFSPAERYREVGRTRYSILYRAAEPRIQ
jgi:hypothetical protein